MRVVEKMIKKIPVILLSIGTILSGVFVQENVDFEKLLYEAEAALANVDSYTAIFHKQERIKGDLMVEETIFLKFKRPFKVYMKWIKAPYKGRECLYVEGANNNRIKAHEGGILGLVTVNLNPLGSRAMKGNRHPITETGLENSVKRIGGEFRKGIEAGEIELKEYGEETVYGRKTIKVEGIFPKEKEKEYYCHRALINLDIEVRVPIKIKIYDWEDKLIENYGYEDLRLNAGLTDADFSSRNSDYRF